jgi:seryl-tRNA synthetase
MRPTPSADAATVTFREELFRRGLLVETGVPGVYGRSGEFDDTVALVERLVMAAGAADRPEVLRFPPVTSRALIERSGYLGSFPHLAGVVRCFDGSERDHRALLRAVESREDWGVGLAATAVVLAPAACYPVYPLLAGTLPPDGRLVDVMSCCFRHEPSDDVARLQSFRMYEYVRAADAQTVLAWRESWLARLVHLAHGMGLDVRIEAASDPFFGRTGALLADSQRGQGLKLEVLAAINGEHAPTAIMSANYHQDHFGELFGIRAHDGSVAHTSCVAFGLERIALALYRRHGLDRARWPQHLRQAAGA